MEYSIQITDTNLGFLTSIKYLQKQKLQKTINKLIQWAQNALIRKK